MFPISPGLIAEAGKKAAGFIPGLIQTGFGIADRIKGKRKLKEAQSFFEENKYAIPEGAKGALGVAERQASGLRLPGEDILRSRAAEATSGAVGAAQQAATSSSDILGVLGNVYGQQQQREQDISLAGANRFDQNQAALRGELGRFAGFEQEKWKYNALMPYQQMLGQAEALSSRGTQGISMGLSAIGGQAGLNRQVQGAENRQGQFMDMMGFTQGNLNPQNRMNPMQSIPFQSPVVDTRTLGGGY